MRSIAFDKAFRVLFFERSPGEIFFMSDGISDQCCGPLNDN